MGSLKKMSREHLKKRLRKQASVESREEPPLPALEKCSTVSSSGSETSLSTPRSNSSYGSVDPPTLLRQATLNSAVSATSRKGRLASVSARRPSLRKRTSSFRSYGTGKSPSETPLPDPAMIALKRQMSTRKASLSSPRPKHSRRSSAMRLALLS